MKDRYFKKRPRKVELDGDAFYVVSMSLADSQKSEDLAKQPETTLEAVRFTLSRICTNEQGELVFSSEADPDIDKMPMEVANRLIVAGRDVSIPPSPGKVLKNSNATT
jgi:hypothetical protein